MPRFFVRSDQIENGTVTILGEDAHHISRSLRMAVGESITVSDMQRRVYYCRLSAFLPDRVLAVVEREEQADTEPPYTVTLYQALLKGDKLDTVIQKAVECGAARIVPFESERCVVRCKPEAEAHKTERRCRIAREAAKQCGRGILPEVLPTVSFLEMLTRVSAADTVIFCYEGENTEPIGAFLARNLPRAGSELAVIIGSEGGFSLSEVEQARSCGFVPIGLGKRILRAETAPTFALACIACIHELQGE
ncbi:MAG: 16S rRNA (uracil(1498)-N(3))-methyltransferase [Clostridia bacterium]|nr:16S rRNA (uracil(1498)-N(3))-methyltransferase [Clostridia bacterium]